MTAATSVTKPAQAHCFISAHSAESAKPFIWMQSAERFIGAVDRESSCDGTELAKQYTREV